jgi:hypothetical protein
MKKEIDDKIYVHRIALRDLSQKQEEIFETLAKELCLNREGEQWMFDYIYNSEEEEKHIPFDEYLSFYKVNYSDLIEK